MRFNTPANYIPFHSSRSQVFPCFFFVVPTSERVLWGEETFEVGGLRVSSFLLALPHLLDDLKGLCGMWSCKTNQSRCKIKQSKMIQPVYMKFNKFFWNKKAGTICWNRIWVRKTCLMPRSESRWTTPWNLVATVLTSTATTAKAIDSTNTICWAWILGSWGGSGLVEFGLVRTIELFIWFGETVALVCWNCLCWWINQWLAT